MAKKENITYSTAIDEIESILSAIENEDIDVDELSEKIKRASELLKFCKTKLRTTEKDIEGIFEEMDKEE